MHTCAKYVMFPTLFSPAAPPTFVCVHPPPFLLEERGFGKAACLKGRPDLGVSIWVREELSPCSVPRCGPSTVSAPFDWPFARGRGCLCILRTGFRLSLSVSPRRHLPPRFPRSFGILTPTSNFPLELFNPGSIIVIVQVWVAVAASSILECPAFNYVCSHWQPPIAGLGRRP